MVYSDGARDESAVSLVLPNLSIITVRSRGSVRLVVSVQRTEKVVLHGNPYWELNTTMENNGYDGTAPNRIVGCFTAPTCAIAFTKA